MDKKSFTLVASQACYGFTIPEVDGNGKHVEKVNRITGIPDLQYRLFKLANVANKASAGYLCKSTFDESTPDVIYKAALEAHKNDPALETQEEYIRRTNPTRAKAEGKLHIMESELVAEKAKAAKAEKSAEAFSEKLAAMQTKLDKLEKGAKAAKPKDK